jgi:predicted class III extradiol MEMO1 family dioxygenase
MGHGRRRNSRAIPDTAPAALALQLAPSMRSRRWLLLAVAALVAGGLGYWWYRPAPGIPTPEGGWVPAAPEPQRVREPVVAGAFYPEDPNQLASMVDRYLADADPAPLPELRALVCPHAGYVYSGPTAAFCYMLSEQVERFAGQGPFTYSPDAHAQEHSLEVQLPFLQRVLSEFSIVPMVFGRTDARQVARRLGEQWDNKTIAIASSDLSHYHPYEVAQRLDNSTIRAILELDVQRMQHEEACGKTPILALMLLARQKGWKTKLLDYRNSGDTAGSKARVVGYAAIAFYQDGAAGDTAG